MAQCISRATGEPMGLIQGDAAQQKALCINFGNTYIDDEGNQFQAQSPEENFTESGAVNTDLTVENENARQNAFEIEKAKIMAQEEAKAKLDAELAAAEAKSKSKSVIDKDELQGIISDNSNNLDEIKFKTSGENASETTIKNVREKPRKDEDTTPVATTDVNTGKTIVSEKTGKETPSSVMSFLGGAGNVALAGTGAALYGAGKVGKEWLKELDFSGGLHGSGGTTGDMSQPYMPEGTQGVQSLEDALPSVEGIAPAGAQSVDDGQFVDTMDGQLANQGYMGPSLDNVVGLQEGPQTMALEGAPQYDIQNLQTGGGATPVDTVSLDRQMSGADGSSLDSRMSGLPVPGMEGMMQTPEEVIAGGQGGVQTPVNPQQLAQLGNEISLGDIQGMLGGVGDTLTSMADGAGDMVDTNKAIQNIEKVLADTGLIDDPQAIEAVNDFVEKVDGLVEKKKEELDTKKSPEEEKSFWDTITDFLGDLMTQFTEITGITSQDLMRALIMYAGSRLLGYSGHDSVQFAYGDFEKNIARRFEDNKESREFLANNTNLQGELDSLYAQKTEAGEGDTSAIDRRIDAISTELNTTSKDTSDIQNFKFYKKKKKQLDDALANGDIDEETHKTQSKDLNDMMKTHRLDVDQRAYLKGIDHKNTTAEIASKAMAAGDAESYKKVVSEQIDLMEKSDKGYRMKLNNDQMLRLVKEADLKTGRFLGNIRQGLRSFATETLGLKIDETASGEMVTQKTMISVLAYISDTKGAISEREMDAFEAASAGHHTSPAGMRLLLETANRFADNDMKRNSYINGKIKELKDNGEIPSVEAMVGFKNDYNRDNPMSLPTLPEIRADDAAKEAADTSVSSMGSATTQEELNKIVQGLGGSSKMSKKQKEAAEAKWNSFQ